MDKPFKPFRDNGDSRQIDQLVIETQGDRIDLHGELSLTRDKQGLALALALKQIVDAAVDVLKAEKLPDRIAEARSKTVPNPFASKS